MEREWPHSHTAFQARDSAPNCAAHFLGRIRAMSF